MMMRAEETRRKKRDGERLQRRSRPDLESGSSSEDDGMITFGRRGCGSDCWPPSVRPSVVEKFEARKKNGEFLRASPCFFQVLHKASTEESLLHLCLLCEETRLKQPSGSASQQSESRGGLINTLAIHLRSQARMG